MLSIEAVNKVVHTKIIEMHVYLNSMKRMTMARRFVKITIFSPKNCCYV